MKVLSLKKCSLYGKKYQYVSGDLYLHSIKKVISYAPNIIDASISCENILVFPFSSGLKYSISD